MTTGIQTEVSRLTAAKGAIAQAIESKGVAVPSGTKLDGMATLIESIEAGGGGGASLDTCTLNLTFSKSRGAEYRYETVGSDGKVEAVAQNFTANTSVTVLCNTRVLLVANSSEGHVVAKENAELELSVSGIGELYIITAPSGGTAWIAFMG